MSMLQPHSSSVIVSAGAECHVGKQRTENQDRILQSATPFGELFVVADGLGGYQGGAEAAQVTVDGFVNFLQAHGNLHLSDALQLAAQSIHADLQRRSEARHEPHGMGSTVVLCIVNGDCLTYAHAGDSRAYLLRDGHLQQLTRDHSVMERMISQGAITAEQAREHPDASVLTRALGQGTSISLDIAEITLHANDSLLLCSDGLWGYARHEEMETIANTRSLPASAVAAALLNLALEGGGGDNISVQFLRFQFSDSPPKSSTSVHALTSKRGLIMIALVSLLLIGLITLIALNYHPPGKQKDPVTKPKEVSATQAIPVDRLISVSAQSASKCAS